MAEFWYRGVPVASQTDEFWYRGVPYPFKTTSIAGWAHKIYGIANANISKIYGKAKTNIAKVYTA